MQSRVALADAPFPCRWVDRPVPSSVITGGPLEFQNGMDRWSQKAEEVDATRSVRRSTGAIGTRGEVAASPLALYWHGCAASPNHQEAERRLNIILFLFLVLCGGVPC